MILAVTLEARFDRTPDGAIWTLSPFQHSFWKRYLEVFDGVRVIARVRDIGQAPHSSARVDGPGVILHPVPYYVGPLWYALRCRQIAHACRAGVGFEDALILRLPSQIAGCIDPILRGGRPYGVEVVGDPQDVFASGAVRHWLLPFFRWYFTGKLKKQCAGACAAAYVTREALQRRYPCAGSASGTSDVELGPNSFRPAQQPYSTCYSSVELSDSDVVSNVREAPVGRTFRLITVGSLEQYYKGTDVLLDALTLCATAGLDFTLTIVGDGALRNTFERRAKPLGSRVRFTGALPAGDAVRAELDGADLFVLPSRTEGLPRAMLEAMARGLPCIGSAVGGIPELLEPHEMVPSGDPRALARLVEEVLSDPARLRTMSQRNFRKAQSYRAEVLHERRQNFYRHVRKTTEMWLESLSRASNSRR